MSHSINHEHSAGEKLSYWEEQLKRQSLKEAPLISKYKWIRPLTVFHSLSFRGRSYFTQDWMLGTTMKLLNMMHGIFRLGMFLLKENLTKNVQIIT